MAETLSGMKRTYMCAEVNENDVNTEVVVMGWVQKRRDLGKLIFIDLRDRSGILQIVFNTERTVSCSEKRYSFEASLWLQ